MTGMFFTEHPSHQQNRKVFPKEAQYQKRPCTIGLIYYALAYLVFYQQLHPVHPYYLRTEMKLKMPRTISIEVKDLLTQIGEENIVNLTYGSRILQNQFILIYNNINYFIYIILIAQQHFLSLISYLKATMFNAILLFMLLRMMIRFL